MEKNFILKGHVCYSVDKDRLIAEENRYVVCVDGKSGGVFKEIPEACASFPVVDYGDRLIIPGFSDLHIHAPQYSYRGAPEWIWNFWNGWKPILFRKRRNFQIWNMRKNPMTFYRKFKKERNNTGMYFCDGTPGGHIAFNGSVGSERSGSNGWKSEYGPECTGLSQRSIL